MLGIGFWAASASTAATAAYELISTTVLGSSAASVTFSSIDTTTYKHLQIRIAGRTDRASTSDGAKIRFNGGTSTDYAYHHLFGSGSSVSSYADAGATYWYVPQGSFGAASAASGIFGAVIADIVDAGATTKNKTMRSLSGAYPGGITLGSTLWVDTAAITSMVIQPDSGTNFVTGSRFSLYGLRGA